MGCSLLFKLFGSGVSGCGFSECFPNWLLERWLGRGTELLRPISCLDAHSRAGGENAVFLLLPLVVLWVALEMWVEVSLGE